MALQALHLAYFFAVLAVTREGLGTDEQYEYEYEFSLFS